MQFDVNVVLGFASLAAGVELLTFKGRWFRLDVLSVRFAVVNLVVRGFAVWGLLAIPVVPRPLEPNEGVVADRVMDPLPLFDAALVVVEADTANLACLCTKDNLCVLGELSPVTDVHVIFAVVAPLALAISFVDDFFDVVDVFVEADFVEAIEGTVLSTGVNEL